MKSNIITNNPLILRKSPKPKSIHTISNNKRIRHSPINNNKQSTQELIFTQYTECFLEDISDLIFSPLSNIDNDSREGYDNQIINEISQRLLASSELISKYKENNTNNKPLPKLYSSFNNNKVSLNYLPEKVMQYPRKTLLLDLDETLVHSTFVPNSFKADITIKLNKRNIYVYKRPYVQEFLIRMSQYYELIIFTASVSNYANSVLNELDKSNCIKHRLYRENCVYHNKGFIKNLSKLGRKLRDIILLDNNPISYSNNTENGIPISSWYSDKKDQELSKLASLLEYLAYVDDVRPLINTIVHENKVNWMKANKILMSKHKTKSWTNSQSNIIPLFLDLKKSNETNTNKKNGSQDEELNSNCIEEEKKVPCNKRKIDYITITTLPSARRKKRSDLFMNGLSSIKKCKQKENKEEAIISRNPKVFVSQSNSLINSIKAKQRLRGKRIKNSLIYPELNTTVKNLNSTHIENKPNKTHSNISQKKTIRNLSLTSKQISANVNHNINKNNNKFKSLIDKLLKHK